MTAQGAKGAQHQSAGQQEQEFVSQRAECDFPDDRQLALGGKPHGVTGRHGRIVDDDTNRLRSGFAGCCGYIVKRCGCQFGDRRDVIE